MTIETYLLYTVVSFFYIISPGPAVFLALANGISGRLKAVVLSSLGNILGLFLLSLVSMLGLGTLILTSSFLFLVVKVIGATYLIYLGIKQFKISKRPHTQSQTLKANTDRTDSSYCLEGFMLAATNPKPVLFFIAIFPQFLNIDDALLPQFLILTLTFMSISFFVLFLYGYLTKSVKPVFANQSNMRWFHRITGGLFIGMGIGLLQLKNTTH
ncbi:MAG: LysE family translocator [Arenicellales bacterium]